MPLKKLRQVAYRLIAQDSHFDTYHPATNEEGNRQAIIFCHSAINADASHHEKTLLQGPEFTFLAPAGYELFAVKGHLSDYKVAEYFDDCIPGNTYINAMLSPPLSDVFSIDEDNQSSLLTVHDDFDVIIVRDPLSLDQFIEQLSATQSYQRVFFHGSRCKENALNIKYFLPVEQHAHILAQNQPLDWSCF